MTKQQLKKKYTDADLQQAKQLLKDFADFLEIEDPIAINTIDNLREVSDELPETFEEL
jgi:hypothetical protein